MFSSLGNFLQVASSVLVITALAAAGFLQARVSNLRASLADLRAEVGDKDRENAKLQAARVLDKAEITRVGNDLDALRRVVTGEAHWVAIGQKLEEHHSAAMTHWDADEELLGRILQAMRDRK